MEWGRCKEDGDEIQCFPTILLTVQDNGHAEQLLHEGKHIKDINNISATLTPKAAPVTFCDGLYGAELSSTMRNYDDYIAQSCRHQKARTQRVVGE